MQAETSISEERIEEIIEFMKPPLHLWLIFKHLWRFQPF